MGTNYPEIQDYTEVRRVLQQEADEEKNWRGARGRLPEVFLFLERKEKEVSKRETDLKTAETAFRGKHADLIAAIETKASALSDLTAQVDGLEADLAAARRANTLKPLVSRLEMRQQELDAAIAAKEEALDKLTTDLNALKKAHGLA
jgi:chromosome segregation ATPase